MDASLQNCNHHCQGWQLCFWVSFDRAGEHGTQVALVWNRDRAHYRKQKPGGQVPGAGESTPGSGGFSGGQGCNVAGMRSEKVHAVMWKWYLNMTRGIFPIECGH